MEAPRTRYAKAEDGTNIAYQVVGEGPIDLVHVAGWVSHVELLWDNPLAALFRQRLADFTRLVMFDKRGTGASDRVAPDHLPTLEQRMDDVRAVMDEVGSERAALFGVSEGGPMSILFAATYPERVSHLVLYGSFARPLPEESFIKALGPEPERVMQRMEDEWADGFPSFDVWAPSLAGIPGAVERLARFNRSSASPAGARALFEMVLGTDVRDVLPTLRVPTLILHRKDERAIGVSHARELAALIPGAKYVELPGEDHLEWAGDMDAIIAEIQEFVVGSRAEAPPDRVLATVLFSDIVESTERAVSEGDRAWRHLLDRHDDDARMIVEANRGRFVKSTGDGVLATFDGPARAVRAANDLVRAATAIGLEVRVGIHTGEVEVRGEDVSGIAVHIGARVAGLAGPRQVLVSRTVRDLVAGSGLTFEDQGVHALKGLPEEWHLFAVAA